MQRIIMLFLSVVSLSLSQMLIHDIGKANTNNKIKFLDAKELQFSHDEVEIVELSALAYKENTLYVLSDKGVLFHFELFITNNKIETLNFKQFYKLKDETGKKLQKKKRDSEGLALYGEELLISFEGKHRVDLYSKDGVKIKEKKIHKDLQKEKNYRSANKGLEAVAYNQRYGIVTAPEKPLEGSDKKYHTLYAKEKTWKFPRDGSLTSLEFMSEHKIMILQRDYNLVRLPWKVTLSSLDLRNSEYEVLASLKSKDGWNIDNFEGLCKVDAKRYLMVSDNNNNGVQKTLLVLFEVD